MFDKQQPPSYNGEVNYIQERKQSIPQQEPVYFQHAPKGWTIVINNRFWTGGYWIFVSEDACEKYDAFKKKKNDANVMDLQRQGIGIPLLKIVLPLNPMSSKFMTIERFLPSSQGAFDADVNNYDYCVVKKYSHMGYNTYIFEFTPDPKAPQLNFQVFMFSHSTLPISDYIFRGERYRWIDESYADRFNTLYQVIFGFKHTMLTPDQPSLCDSWDGKHNKLDNKKSNPYLSSYFKTKLNSRSRFPKPEYYGHSCSAILGEADSYSSRGYAELKTADTYSGDSNKNYESTLSVNEDALVLTCIATVLKREKDIEQEKRRQQQRRLRSGANNNFLISMGV
ncbi:hypothetical protein KGF54_001811 [Candida jiufengensis]|uniref:uncharacterized protein n=1 Tax=Candida jiufengensis TaxID=497108 RepID=UPI00222474A3|nr:uncharacterized protein KGF54_001811 [Candida jiufengensis]KAI5955250.1 hypothetical protein KGF54_001811 [Candida jiufengensis]